MEKRYSAPIKLHEFKLLLSENECYYEYSRKHCKIYLKNGQYLTNFAIDHKRGEVKPAYINNFFKLLKGVKEKLTNQNEENNNE